jgi:hypothetical protein
VEAVRSEGLTDRKRGGIQMGGIRYVPWARTRTTPDPIDNDGSKCLRMARPCEISAATPHQHPAGRMASP